MAVDLMGTARKGTALSPGSGREMPRVPLRPTPPIAAALGPQAMPLLKSWNLIELGQGAHEFHLPKSPKG